MPICGDKAKNKPAALAAAQTLPDEASPIGKIHPISKIAFGIKKVLDHYDIVHFITGSAISYRLGMAAP